MKPPGNAPAAGLTRHPALFLVVMPVLAVLTAVVTVQHEPELPFRAGLDLSPRGYTLSLGLFVVPSAMLALWFRRPRPRLPYPWRAFWIALAIVAPIWCLLDILLGNAFFRFPDTGATLGILALGYEFGRGWVRTIPVEEFAFYVLGCCTVLLGYIWAAESWLSAYTLPPDEYLRRSAQVRRLVNVRAAGIVAGAMAFGLALLWKKLGPHEHTGDSPVISCSSWSW